MAKCKCPDPEFNPWPSFVDLFSAVILVLLFFILVIIVLLAWYMQFKYVERDHKQIEVLDPHPTNQNIKKEIIQPRVPKVDINDFEIVNTKIGQKFQKMKTAENKDNQTFIIKEEESLSLFFNREEKVLATKKFELIKNFVKGLTKPEDLIIYVSVPNSYNIESVNKRMVLTRAINTNNYLTNLKREFSNIKSVDFQVVQEKDENKFKFEEKITDEMLQNGFVKIQVKR